jgi:deazaflavin-dependent oxidoreductase (nitroreductase family)
MTIANDFNQSIVDEFRANDGVVGGMFAGRPVVLLTTTGAKSGLARTSPLVCLPEDVGTMYVFASAGGAAKDPSWYRNLVAHPEVEVEVGTDSFTARATTLEGAERDALYAQQVERVPDFAEYARTAGRVIPVVKLDRIS